jgi:hypothetical protein
MDKIVLALTIGFGALVAAGDATAYTARVNSACKTDFYKFCPSYKPDSPQLRECMRSAGGNISSRCLDALADSGVISRKYRSK